MTEDAVKTLVAEIRSSAKYRDLPILDEVIADLIMQESRSGRKQKEVLKAVKKKLHNISALYLGDPDYPAETERLTQIDNQPDLYEFCQSIARQHTSTLERLAYAEEFYHGIFEVTGTPNNMLDLACALNPFLFPWMGLPDGVEYYAYDIHPQRIDFINHFFAHVGIKPLATLQDILLHPPQQQADCALILKEVHRFEQRRKGISRALIDALNARWIVVSLPTQSMSGRRSLDESYRNLFYNIVGDTDWAITELTFPGEQVFCIQKHLPD